MNSSDTSASDSQHFTQKRSNDENITDKIYNLSIASPKVAKLEHQDSSGMPDHSCRGSYILKLDKHQPEELCSACKELAVHPMTVIECGHTYGKAVIDRWQRDGVREVQCVGHDIDGDDETQCQSRIRLADLKLNKAVDKGIGKKGVFCTNKTKGCRSEMKLKELEEHMRTTCQYADVKCRSCNQMFPRRELPAHEKTCTAQRCPFAAVGCTDVSTPEKKAVPSSTGDAALHLGLLFHVLASVKAVVDFRPKEFNNSLNEQVKENEGQEQIVRLIDEPDRVKEEEMKISEAAKSISTLKQDAAAHSGRLASVMHEELPADVAASLQRSRHRQEFLLLHEEITNEAMNKQMEMIQQSPILHNPGSVIFKVNSFTEKRTSAIQGTLKKGIYGPPFLTHEFGYKMVPILYPNGDGSGAGTHLSIFLAVMKSEYDALLRWPLMAKITMSILSQKQVGREAVKHVFRTDVASLSYQRPPGEINQASGIPKALDLALLRQPSDYLVDDTLFIQVIVEPTLPSSQRS